MLSLVQMILGLRNMSLVVGWSLLCLMLCLVWIKFMSMRFYVMILWLRVWTFLNFFKPTVYLKITSFLGKFCSFLETQTKRLYSSVSHIKIEEKNCVSNPKENMLITLPLLLIWWKIKVQVKDRKVRVQISFMVQGRFITTSREKLV